MSLDLRLATPANFKKNVAAGGTPERLSATELKVRSAVVRARSTNTGRVAVGNSGVRAALASENAAYLNAGEVQVLGPCDLNAWFVDAAVNGEGVLVTAEVAA